MFKHGYRWCTVVLMHSCELLFEMMSQTLQLTAVASDTIMITITDSRPFHCWESQVNSAFHPSGLGKLSTSLLTGV